MNAFAGTPVAEEQDEERAAWQGKEGLARVLGRLESEARDRVGRRTLIEKRWLEDLSQYHGKYDREGAEKLEKKEGSTVFVNQTRPKTNAITARLFDLMFPTEDRNWDIKPTPVPQVDEQTRSIVKRRIAAEQKLAEAEAAGQAASQMNDEAGKQSAEGQAQAAEAEIDIIAKAQEELDAVIEETTRRARLMRSEIDDNLKACRFPMQARDVIEDGAKVGTGVMKGPISSDRMRNRYSQTSDGVWDLERRPEHDRMTPAHYRVDYWGFFPDPDAANVEESDSFLERHLWTGRKMRQNLARRDDVDQDALRRILLSGPSQDEVPSYLTELQWISDGKDAQVRDRYVVWEYTGPLEVEELEILRDETGDEYLSALDLDDLDPLLDIVVRIWFCQGELLSFGIHPLDTNEPLYHVFNLEKDEASIFGYGMPYLMRNPQSVYNTAWRMMLDNAGIAAGPQVVVRKDKVTPVNGEWKFHPFKFWYADGEYAQGQKPFEAFSMDSHQAEYANILALSREQIDEETGLPQIAQGEQGSNVTKTFQGMALLMNSANVLFRRFVKNFDDDIIVPTITATYHWNMQFSDREEIKGDFDIDARGSSVLLVREIQSNNLMLLMSTFADHPVFGAMMKQYDAFSQLVLAMQVTPSSILKGQMEYERDVKKQENPAVIVERLKKEQEEIRAGIEQAKNEKDIEIANLDADTRREVAQLQRDTQMMISADRLNLSFEQMEKQLQDRREDRSMRERNIAAEIAMANRTGESAGGSI